ncbi:hypothetical protein GCM10010182_79680 [Actinomadura cremea]|nr:hypothetical protein GCM10010182_79680 [Actinomadura cremea]
MRTCRHGLPTDLTDANAPSPPDHRGDGPGGAGARSAAVESRLGTALPSDYKLLVETFGCDGLFDEFFHVFTPEELVWHTEVYAGGFVPGGEHPPPFPEAGGVIPWAGNENEDRFFWTTGARDPDDWSVYALDSLNEGSRFDCTATEFLFRQMTDASDFRGHWFMRTVG